MSVKKDVHWQLHIENESKTKVVRLKFYDNQELITLDWKTSSEVMITLKQDLVFA